MPLPLLAHWVRTGGTEFAWLAYPTPINTLSGMRPEPETGLAHTSRFLEGRVPMLPPGQGAGAT